MQGNSDLSHRIKMMKKEDHHKFRQAGSATFHALYDIDLIIIAGPQTPGYVWVYRKNIGTFGDAGVRYGDRRAGQKSKFSSAHYKPISYARAKNSREGGIKAIGTKQIIIRWTSPK
jgi:hypothetical protein